jgi:hypothetical protein
VIIALADGRFMTVEPALATATPAAAQYSELYEQLDFKHQV